MADKKKSSSKSTSSKESSQKVTTRVVASTASSKKTTKKPASTAEKPAAVKSTKATEGTKKAKTPRTKRTRTKDGYFKGAWHELRQVRWPDRSATWKLTFAVIVYSVFFFVMVIVLDAIFKYFFDLLIK